MAAKKKRDYIEILISRGVVSPDQLSEAEDMARHSGQELAEALTGLGYATGEEVMRAMAEEHGLDFINLGDVVVPPSVLELVPESVARENVILPLAEEDGDERAAALSLARRRRIGPFRPGERAAFRQKDMAVLARAGFPFEVARAVIDGEVDSG